MAVPGKKKIGGALDRDGGAEAEKENGGNDEPDVGHLIGEDDGVKTKAAGAHAVLGSQPDDAEIVDEQRPNHRRKDGVENKPPEGISEFAKGQHFHEGAGEIKKIVHEFERPTNERQG